MEPFIVSARKYRPQKFSDVVGQKAITSTLENAIKSDHLAQALLFTGPRGVGKTTCARILAKMINQESSDNISEDEDFAFNIFELDAASNNSVDDIRNLTDQVRIPPQTGNYKVYIIDEVHMLSQAAFNAFLKTLEEPPAHAIFILATTEKHKIIPTILSRCQIFDFKRIGVSDIKNYLHKIAKEEGITADDDALHIIAQKADGALRDALSTFDRVVSFSGKKLTRQAVTENLNVLDYDYYFKVTDLLVEHKIPETLLVFNEILDKGFDGHHFISGLSSHFRDLMVAKDPATVPLLEVGDNTKNLYLKQAVKISLKFLLQALDMANDCDLKYKTSKNQRLLVELTLMQIASIDFDGEKKKSEYYIIPSSHFAGRIVEEKADLDREYIKDKIHDTPVESPAQPVIKQQTIVTELVKPEPPVLKKADPGNKRLRKSALSINSLNRKKEEEAAQRNRESMPQDHEDLPVDSFTDTAFFNAWNEFIDILLKDGKKIHASILKADKPKVEGNLIHVTYANKLMADELNMIKPKTLKYLRTRLNNFSLKFKVNINEEQANKVAYTTLEKYDLLKSKNPDLDLLKKTFKLDL